MRRDLQRQLHAAEPFDRNVRHDLMLEAPGLPVEAGALGDVQVGDLHRPAGGAVFPRDQPAQGAFADATLLRYETDDGRHGLPPCESSRST